MNTIYLRFYKINMSIESSDFDFIDFLTGYFPTQVSDINKDHCQIKLVFKNVPKTEYDTLHQESKLNYPTRLSRSIFCNNNLVFLTDLMQFPGLLLKFELEKNVLHVNGYYYSQEGIITKLVQNKNHRLKLFLYLKYYLILFPLIWYYEQFLNKYLLHASALLYQDKTIIFSGLGGVGKSTLIISLLSNPDFQFISDNLVVYGNDEVIGVHEAIALDQNSLKLCSNAISLLTPLDLDMSHNRKYYRVKKTIESGEKVNKVFFLKFDKISQIQQIDKLYAKEKLELINSIAKEIITYRSIASALNFALGKQYNLLRESCVDQLILNADTFELDIMPGQPLTDVNTLLQKLLL